MRITLDAETFKALASPTRLSVLRALDERRKTLTEVSRDLSLNKATVHEHLALLVAADLVRKRDDEGRKWIYYELTWRGSKLLHPQETTTFNVLLGLGVAAAGGGLGLLARSLYTALEPHVEPLTPAPSAPTGAGDMGNPAIAADAGTSAAPQAAASANTGTATGTYAATSSAPASATASPGAGASAPYADTASHADTVSTATATSAPSTVHPGLLDDWGALGLALLGFAALMALLAWLMRRHLRADPFRPPSDPKDT